MNLILGDCIEKMGELGDASIAAVVTDPPYGIGFMGHEWDQPGEHGAVRANGRPRPFAAGGDRRELQRAMARSQRRGTHHTGTGFDTRPSDNGAFEAGRYDFSPSANSRFQAWCEAWAAEALRVLKPGGHALVFGGTRTYHRLACGLEDAGFEIRDCLIWLYGSGFPKSLNLDGDWEGWGTALKPAHEPIVAARKPLAGTVAANVLEHGTGTLNIDGCRVDVGDRVRYERNHSGDRGHGGTRSIEERGATDLRPGGGSAAAGRWPANVVLDEGAAELLDEQSGVLISGANPTRRGSDKFRGAYHAFAGQEECEAARGSDAGGASRFFYCAKTSRAERNAGLDGFNDHPTVKPIDLMRWLVRLVTPGGGLVLDPFLGSGTTGIATTLEGFDCIGIERAPDYLAIAEARIAFWREHGEDGLRIVAERDAAQRRREEVAAAGQLDLLGEVAAS